MKTATHRKDSGSPTAGHRRGVQGKGRARWGGMASGKGWHLKSALESPWLHHHHVGGGMFCAGWYQQRPRGLQGRNVFEADVTKCTKGLGLGAQTASRPQQLLVLWALCGQVLFPSCYDQGNKLRTARACSRLDPVGQGWGSLLPSSHSNILPQIAGSWDCWRHTGPHMDMVSQAMGPLSGLHPEK